MAFPEHQLCTGLAQTGTCLPTRCLEGARQRGQGEPLNPHIHYTPSRNPTTTRARAHTRTHTHTIGVSTPSAMAEEICSFPALARSQETSKRGAGNGIQACLSPACACADCTGCSVTHGHAGLSPAAVWRASCRALHHLPSQRAPRSPGEGPETRTSAPCGALPHTPTLHSSLA